MHVKQNSPARLRSPRRRQRARCVSLELRDAHRIMCLRRDVISLFFSDPWPVSSCVVRRRVSTSAAPSRLFALSGHAPRRGTAPARPGTARRRASSRARTAASRPPPAPRKRQQQRRARMEAAPAAYATHRRDAQRLCRLDAHARNGPHRQQGAPHERARRCARAVSTRSQSARATQAGHARVRSGSSLRRIWPSCSTASDAVGSARCGGSTDLPPSISLTPSLTSKSDTPSTVADEAIHLRDPGAGGEARGAPRGRRYRRRGAGAVGARWVAVAVCAPRRTLSR